jgi:hypothetical protein
MDSLFLLGCLVGILATATFFIGSERSMERRS